jgi:hypothetical protein
VLLLLGQRRLAVKAGSISVYLRWVLNFGVFAHLARPLSFDYCVLMANLFDTDIGFEAAFRALPPNRSAPRLAVALGRVGT